MLRALTPGFAAFPYEDAHCCLVNGFNIFAHRGYFLRVRYIAVSRVEPSRLLGPGGGIYSAHVPSPLQRCKWPAGAALIKNSALPTALRHASQAAYSVAPCQCMAAAGYAEGSSKRPKGAKGAAFSIYILRHPSCSLRATNRTASRCTMATLGYCGLAGRSSPAATTAGWPVRRRSTASNLASGQPRTGRATDSGVPAREQAIAHQIRRSAAAARGVHFRSFATTESTALRCSKKKASVNGARCVRRSSFRNDRSAKQTFSIFPTSRSFMLTSYDRAYEIWNLSY